MTPIIGALSRESYTTTNSTFYSHQSGETSVDAMGKRCRRHAHTQKAKHSGCVCQRDMRLLGRPTPVFDAARAHVSYISSISHTHHPPIHRTHAERHHLPSPLKAQALRLRSLHTALGPSLPFAAMAATKLLAALFMAMMVSAAVATPLSRPGELDGKGGRRDSRGRARTLWAS